MDAARALGQTPIDYGDDAVGAADAAVAAGSRAVPAEAGQAARPAGSDGAPDPDGAAGPDGLTTRDRDILAFERRWWRYAGAKEQAIRTAFEVSATRYYQLLNSLIDKPAALVADPMLVRRLRRLRADRRLARSGRPRPSGI